MTLEVKITNYKRTYYTITLKFDSVKIMSTLHIPLYPAIITEMLYLTLALPLFSAVYLASHGLGFIGNGVY